MSACEFGFDQTGVGGWCVTHRRWLCTASCLEEGSRLYPHVVPVEPEVRRALIRGDYLCWIVEPRASRHDQDAWIEVVW